MMSYLRAEQSCLCELVCKSVLSVQGVAISNGAVLFHHLAVPNQKDEHSCTSTSKSVAAVRSVAPISIAL